MLGSRFLPELLKGLYKSPGCSKHPTRMTRGDNAMFTTPSRGTQLSSDLLQVFVQGDSVQRVTLF